MAYSAQTFVADEQPTTAKWNLLWSNDASFNDGTGIATGAITSAKISGLDKSLTTTDSNPYKFRCTRTGAMNTSASAQAKITYDTEQYDTNNNFASGTYTAPVAGFYSWTAQCSVTANPGSFFLITLYKNGSGYQRGNQLNSTGATIAQYADSTQASASDTFDMYVYATNAVALGVSAPEISAFSGFLISRT